uniref:Ig-like domain-containing protein n=1 Tax=Acanthochromis polyacanthus TaxID=80966 RepID=A0A3Q1GWL6_9TELE
ETLKILTPLLHLMIPPLTEGKQTTLTCTAPGLCSGSRPKISWMWTERHRSTLDFSPSAEHHGTNITCKVRFKGGTTTEKTLTLNVNCEYRMQMKSLQFCNHLIHFFKYTHEMFECCI